MPTKHYVLLYSPAENTLTFPIKAPINTFNNKTEQFAGGYPWLFGGNDKGGVEVTLVEETDEESGGTLAVEGPFNEHNQFHFGWSEKRDAMYFYWSDKGQRTGLAWRKPTSFDQGEMTHTATVELTAFSGIDAKEQVLARLVELSRAPGGTPAQYTQFMASHTAEAFFQFIRAVGPSLRHAI